MNVTAWVVRLGSIAVGLIGWGVERSTFTSDANSVSFINRLEIGLGGLLVAGVFLGMLGVSRLVSRYAKRYLVRVVAAPADLAPGGYVLYLRPFSLDKSMSAMTDLGAPSDFSAFFASSLTQEERVARLLREFGPLVTVGRPDEPLPTGSGAWRVYIPRHGWKPIVSELISHARLIVLGAGPGTGTAWEYAEVLRRREPSRLLILVTSRAAYDGFRSSSAATAQRALPELQVRHGSSWRVPVLPDLPVPGAPKAPPPADFRFMVYFSADWTPRLAAFDWPAVRSRKLKASKRDPNPLAPVFANVRAGGKATALADRPPPGSPEPSSARPAASDIGDAATEQASDRVNRFVYDTQSPSHLTPSHPSEPRTPGSAQSGTTTVIKPARDPREKKATATFQVVVAGLVAILTVILTVLISMGVQDSHDQVQVPAPPQPAFTPDPNFILPSYAPIQPLPMPSYMPIQPLPTLTLTIAPPATPVTPLRTSSACGKSGTRAPRRTSRTAAVLRHPCPRRT